MTRAEAIRIRKMIEETATLLPDETALERAILFPLWQSGAEYKAGDRLRGVNGKLYKVLIDHTSQSDWQLVDSPSLYAEVLAGQDGTEVGEWTQPDSTNPYMIGDRVTYNGKVYESIVDNNVWRPDEYGWIEVEE